MLKVVAMLYFITPGSEPLTGEAVPALEPMYVWMTGFAVIGTIAGLGGGFVLFRKLLGKPDVSASNFMERFRSANIIRFGLLEGFSFFGLVVLLIVLFDTYGPDLIAENSFLWLNVLPTIVVLLFAIRMFPTRERIASYYEEFVLSRSRL